MQKIGRRYDTPMQLSSDILSVLVGVPEATMRIF